MAGGGDARFERDSTTVQSAQSTHDDHDHLPVFVSGRGEVKEDTLKPFNRHFRD